MSGKTYVCRQAFLHNSLAEKKKKHDEGRAFEMSTAYSKNTVYITLGLDMRQHAKYFTVVGFSCPRELIKLFLIQCSQEACSALSMTRGRQQRLLAGKELLHNTLMTSAEACIFRGAPCSLLQRKHRGKREILCLLTFHLPTLLQTYIS